MKKMFLIFNHTLTQKQATDARAMGVNEFVSLPSEPLRLKEHLRNIDPCELDIKKIAQPFIVWLAGLSQKGDYVLVQAEHSFTVYVAHWCYCNELVPVCATTPRNVPHEVQKGETVHKSSVFQHHSFRKYQFYQ